MLTSQVELRHTHKHYNTKSMNLQSSHTMRCCNITFGLRLNEPRAKATHHRQHTSQRQSGPPPLGWSVL